MNQPSAKTRVAIMGATGYTAYELIRILLRHPHCEITALTSRQEAGQPISHVHSSLTGRLNLSLENFSPEEISGKADVAFTCLPHTASMQIVPRLLAEGIKVIDLSADYRLKDPGVYEQWYGHVHTDPTRLGETVYGLPEIYGPKISGHQLVANPGCYTSTSILALAPLLAQNLIEPHGICIDGKSGVSGAGRTPKQNILYAECNESLSAYSVGNHRHTPEIDQVLSDVSGQNVEVNFTPHLIPMDRGILCSIYCRPTQSVNEADLLERFKAYYAGMPFVRVVSHLPKTKDVANTNYCDITVRYSRGIVMVFAALDNLIKGASGVAVQNLNIISGWDETTGLIV
jgi:N-acetyl-gamma-glutamyl-phosphate reductase